MEINLKFWSSAQTEDTASRFDMSQYIESISTLLLICLAVVVTVQVIFSRQCSAHTNGNYTDAQVTMLWLSCLFQMAVSPMFEQRRELARQTPNKLTRPEPEATAPSPATRLFGRKRKITSGYRRNHSM